MPSLTELIQGFQRGSLTRDEFLASVDLALKEDPTDSTQFARVLSEEHTRFPLPAAVYAEVMRRIDSRAATQFDPLATSIDGAADEQSGGEGTRIEGTRNDETRVEETRIESTRVEPEPSDRVTPPPYSAGAGAGNTGTNLGTSTGTSTGTNTGSSTGSSSGSQSGSSFVSGFVPAGPTKGVGDTLNGRFVLEECLGVGGMGTVYKALDLRKLEASDRKPYIAIKVLNMQFAAHPKSLMALQREARKAQQLAHRNIVTVYDFDRDGSTVYLTMEYLSGKSLNRVLRAPDFEGLPYAKALPIITGMGRALAYAHERGFVHCDFKPANVFLTDRGEVKVIDFGIARGFQQPADDADQTVFDPGSLGGMTPAYASPEMFEHRDPDPRDDIYALACVTYELLTGKHPYNRLSATEARGRNLKPVQPTSLSRSQWKALRQGLSFDRATRTPTVTRFLAGLGAEPQQDDNRLPIIIGGAVAGVAILTGVGFYAWRVATTPQPMQKKEVVASQVTKEETTKEETPAAKPAPPPSAPPSTPPSPAAPPTLTMAAVAPVLARTACSLLTAGIDGSALQVEGYASEKGVPRLREQLRAIPGVESLKFDVLPLTDDKCDVVRIVAPYWSGHKAGGAVLRTRGNGQLVEGTPLVLDINTPPHDTYVYVDYFVVDGKVAHLVPSALVQGNQAPPNYSATIGDGGDWVISKPFGTELVVLLTTPAPLLASRRQEFESRQDYLRAIEAPLAQMASKYGKDQVSADLVQISTRAK